jgi:DNA polymerase-2
LLDELFPRREAARKAGDEVASHAIKILMNSFYGVLGTPACRFYNPALANSITGSGREILLWSKRWFESTASQCCMATRTACSCRQPTGDPEAASDQARQIAAALNADLARYILERWRVPSRLELKFEKLYLKLFLPHARHSTRGASKRYAGLRHGAACTRWSLSAWRSSAATGLPSPRKCSVSCIAASSAINRSTSYLADVVRRVRSGELDDALVYRKNLRKEARGVHGHDAAPTWRRHANRRRRPGA